MPPEATTGNLDIFKTDELFRAGKVASNLEWIGFAESSIHPETSKVADKIAFAQLPGLKTDKGVERWSVIGGQPFVLMTWNTGHPEQGGARLRASGGCRRIRRSPTRRLAVKAR